MWRSTPVAGQEALMAANDKRRTDGGRVAAKSRTEERLATRMKKLAAESMANQSEGRTFGP
jgi:hypothetical protein